MVAVVGHLESADGVWWRAGNSVYKGLDLDGFGENPILKHNLSRKFVLLKGLFREPNNNFSLKIQIE